MDEVKCRNWMPEKACKKCKVVKKIDEFYIRKKDKRPFYIGTCFTCKSHIDAQYRNEHQEEIKNYRETHKEESAEWHKAYRLLHKDRLTQINDKYIEEHRDELSAQKHLYYLANIDEKKAYYEKHKPEQKKRDAARYEADKDGMKAISAKYRSEHKEELKISRRKRDAEKRKHDPVYSMRMFASSSIRDGLKRSGASKNGSSCWQHLPYTPQQLKDYIENLFEPWMNWNNRGKYNKSTWKDDDQTTWTWQLDHIVPHSTFGYETMDCDAFRQCWALSNLRPLSAKQNVIDGWTKARHKNS